ncbi:MAG TPA: hypothetical protein VH253_18870 [Phycisphaerae bacterium]|nr:hypothetical protein [Phycisphaerae bacterium]
MPTPPSNEPTPAPTGGPHIGNRHSPIGNESTGLPLLSTWPRLYAFILLFFAACVLALTWLTRAFS